MYQTDNISLSEVFLSTRLELRFAGLGYSEMFCEQQIRKHSFYVGRGPKVYETVTFIYII